MLRGSIRILAWVSGSASAVNADSTPSSPTTPVTIGAAFTLPSASRWSESRNSQRRVAEHETQVDLLVDRQRRPDPVGLHAHADDDDAREQRRAGDELVDHAGHPDALEDDRVLRGRGADRLGQLPDALPRHQRDAPQLVHRADCEVEDLGGRDQVPVVRGRRERRVLRRIDDDVGAARGGQRAPPGREVAGDTVRTPLALSMQMTASPTGPQPMTIADLALADLAAPHRVQADRHRFGQGGQLGGQAVRDGEGQ